MEKENKILIVEADSIVDGRGSHQKSNAILDKVKEQGIPIMEYIIDPLKAGWDTPIKENHFRSGCAPILALDKAVSVLKENPDVCVLVKGEDFLKSRYSSSERRRLMRIYEGMEIYEAYDYLAVEYTKRIGFSVGEFKVIAEALFENYKRTYLKKKRPDDFPLPTQEWYYFISGMFRGVDCANPVIDFSGQLVLVSSLLMQELPIQDFRCISVKAVAKEVLDFDGPAYVPELAEYCHLRRVFDRALDEAGINFRRMFLDGEILLELYTCFPVVPLAFLLETGLASNFSEVMNIIERIPLTVTGGMNLGRAPWNNPVLNSIIHIYEKLEENKIGACHGNGGLGYAQGFCLFEKECGIPVD